MKNSKKEIVEVKKEKKTMSLMYKDLEVNERIGILGIKESNSGPIGKVELEGNKNEIIENIDKLKNYNIKDYTIIFNDGNFKINIEIK
ncbi:MAG: hypothetical protein ACRDDY_07835 [Clostridium sp.]